MTTPTHSHKAWTDKGSHVSTACCSRAICSADRVELRPGSLRYQPTVVSLSCVTVETRQLGGYLSGRKITPRTRFLDLSIHSRFNTNNKIQKAGANETAYANKQCPLLILSVRKLPAGEPINAAALGPAQ